MSDEPIGGPLVLRHAGKRTSGTWGLDDYDVIDIRRRDIGRISKPRAGARRAPGRGSGRSPGQGHAASAVARVCATLDEAKAKLAEKWRAWLARGDRG